MAHDKFLRCFNCTCNGSCQCHPGESTCRNHRWPKVRTRKSGGRITRSDFERLWRLATFANGMSWEAELIDAKRYKNGK